jgi:hypothetical protein
MNPALKQFCKFKHQLGEQIIACAAKQDEALSKAVLMFAELSFQCLQSRDAHYTLDTTYTFGTYTGVQRNSSPYWITTDDHGVTEHEKIQNRHAEKCFRQWDAETGFCVQHLHSAIDAAIESNKQRLAVRLMATQQLLTKVTADRVRKIRSDCENTGPKGHSSKDQRTIQDYTEKHGAVHFVPSNGMCHLFPDEEKATAFRRLTKEQVEAEAAIALYESKGFRAFASIGEALNTDLWTEFREFCLARKRKR